MFVTYAQFDILRLCTGENSKRHLSLGHTWIREIVALCAQDVELDVLLSVRTNLKFYGMIRGIAKNELETRINEVVELFGLTEHQHKRVFELSGGLM